MRLRYLDFRSTFKSNIPNFVFNDEQFQCDKYHSTSFLKNESFKVIRLDLSILNQIKHRVKDKFKR